MNHPKKRRLIWNHISSYLKTTWWLIPSNITYRIYKNEKQICDMDTWWKNRVGYCTNSKDNIRKTETTYWWCCRFHGKLTWLHLVSYPYLCPAWYDSACLQIVICRIFFRKPICLISMECGLFFQQSIVCHVL